ncbi:substrate-binding domain-containing protein [Aminobacter carboxidus]|uniref:Ribose transport system substrate-binding protein/inositol transport system substrate-binding protein n=1 Tax=Aminobacter carboxidus TaxID=376165 RepID=A0A8E1WG15_9HYPH|nr:MULTISPECIES: substrate-binding domain-containing protein [Aminobacter carboxidus group]MBB6467323.1 ribose transport system substrate-binding protein/inositol transport system substrate-binding protein [Aminobacter lissarensis]MBE1208311.1 substrate-binding domain-containing protein [Aminobacter carboxidus]
MKKYLLGAALSALMTGSALAGDIGVSMANSDTFLTVLRKGIEKAAADASQPVVIEIADDDVNKQLSQVQNFIAAKVDAIIVNAVDTSATTPMTKLANDAGIPIVYVNRQPIDVDALGEKGAFVASDEAESGTLETKEACRLLKAAGKTEAGILVMQGDLANQAAVMRTKDVHDVIATPDCSFIKIIDEQTAGWDPVKAQDLMTNWIAAGHKPDAVIANNDNMAIGAINAMKAAGWDMKDVIVGGVDATQEALAYMKAGDLDVTVFQDAAGQGGGAIKAAMSLAKGEKVEPKVWIPFQLVTPENMDQFVSKN